MSMAFAGEAELKRGARQVEGGEIEIGGERFYRIVNYDAMAPFLMSLVSDSDHWMFVSSTGALTAGRRDPDHALFPYYTDDRIHDSQDQTGGKTVLLAARGGRTSLWEPFSQRYEGLYRITRSLSKSVYSNKIVFEEVNHSLGLSFSCAWMTSDRFGFMRRSALVNLGEDPIEIDLLDGIQNLLPHGITRRFQMEYSTLADGYKENELEPETGLGLFKLSSVPADRPEPNEALRVTTVWSEGMEPARRLLCSAQLDRFRRGEAVEEETLIRGRRGAYFVNARMALPAGARKEWSVVAEVDRDAAGVAAMVRLLQRNENLRAQLDEDVECGTRNLVRIVAAADGLELTGDDLSADRHFSNTLFNVMRGGIPDRGYAISRADFQAFLGKANHAVAERQAAFLDALDETLLHSRLLELARAQDDPDLERLAHEYLPLTFSRRHGDPSRPWNIFCHRGEERARRANPQLPGQLARYFPELGGAGALVPRLCREHDLQIRRRLYRRWLQPVPHHARRFRLGGARSARRVVVYRLLGRPPGGLPLKAARGFGALSSRRRGGAADAPRLHLRQRSLSHQAV